MKSLAVLILSVLLILIVETDCGVVERVYNGAADAVDTTKQAIGGIFSFGKDLVLGKNEPYPDKETGRHSDGIVGGVMNTISNGAGYIRKGVSKVMDYEHSLRQKVVGVFKDDSSNSKGDQGTPDQGKTGEDNKENEPVYHYGEGLLDVRMADNFNRDIMDNINNTKNYITGVNNDIYDKVNDGYGNIKENLNKHSNIAIDNAHNAADNVADNLRGAKDQFSQNMDNLKYTGKQQVANIENNFKNTIDKENEMLNTVSKKVNENSIYFGEVVKPNTHTLDKLSYGDNKKK